MSYWNTIKNAFLSLGAPRTEAPGNTQHRIDVCMKNYQRAKMEHLRASRRGDIAEMVLREADMEYWEAYLLEVGAMSVKMAASPFGGAGTWGDYRHVAKRMAAGELRVRKEDSGAPWSGPYLEVPPLEE